MISNDDIQRLIHRAPSNRPVLSAFIDMSVNADNKRTYPVYLNQQRTQYMEAGVHPREVISAGFDAVNAWIQGEFREANKGVAVFVELAGDWVEGLQVPLALRNHTVIDEQPVVTPLAEIVETQRRHGVILVDRENLRMIDVWLGEAVHEHKVETEPLPAPHDVQRGGYAQKNFQKRKAEEVRHFWKEFAVEVGEFIRRYRTDDLVLLGTDENVKNFLDFLPAEVRDRVVHTDHEAVDASTAEVLARLARFTSDQRRRREAEVIDVVHDRVRNRHFAASGFRDTLQRLQEGKVERLILARDTQRRGARCTRCRFYLASRNGACPYCGGEVRDNVNLAEAMVRIAEEQDIPIQFVPSQAMVDLDGVGALLKF